MFVKCFIKKQYQINLLHWTGYASFLWNNQLSEFTSDSCRFCWDISQHLSILFVVLNNIIPMYSVECKSYRCCIWSKNIYISVVIDVEKELYFYVSTLICSIRYCFLITEAGRKEWKKEYMFYVRVHVLSVLPCNISLLYKIMFQHKGIYSHILSVSRLCSTIHVP